MAPSKKPERTAVFCCPDADRISVPEMKQIHPKTGPWGDNTVCWKEAAMGLQLAALRSSLGREVPAGCGALVLNGKMPVQAAKNRSAARINC